MFRFVFFVVCIFLLAGCAYNQLLSTNQKPFYYSWKESDNLESIAKKFGDNVLELRRRNHIYEPEDLYAGFKILIIPKQKIIIPKTQKSTKLVLAYPTAGLLTSKYGWRKGRKHYGVDFGANKGKEIVAVANGIVSRVGYRKGYGNTIEIQHTSQVTTLYAHLSKILVKKNQKIQKQQQIGIMGNTGQSQGVHLHFEVIVNNEAINPLKVFSPKPTRK